MCYTRPSIFGRHYRLDDDHTHVIDERRVAQDILRQVHRRVPGHMFRDGLRFATGLVKYNIIIIIMSATRVCS
jgi:hypothetical protein